MSRPRRPAGLGARAVRYWDWAWETFEFSPSESEVLTEVVRMIETVERLDRAVRSEGVTFVDAKGNPRTNPAVAELRLQRVALVKLVAALGLPEESPLESPATKAARKAAQSRWAAEKRRRGVVPGADAANG